MKSAIHSDVLIIGCGIAGGTAALELADAGLDVVIVTRAAAPAESNTYWAQGGRYVSSLCNRARKPGCSVSSAGW